MLSTTSRLIEPTTTTRPRGRRWPPSASMTGHYRRGDQAVPAGGLHPTEPPAGRWVRVPRKIILDCDPGIDDALAIVFAWGEPDLEIQGITTVAGNVSLDKTTANALRVCEFVGAADVPVVAGRPRPPLRPPLGAPGADRGARAARRPVPPPPPRPRRRAAA